MNSMLRIAGRSAVRVSLAALGLGLTSSTLLAGGYDEATSGDLSGNGLTPTGVTLTPGSNPISGTTGRGSGGVDRDYFTFTVPNGVELYAIDVLDGTTSGGTKTLSFIALEAGNQVTVPTSATDASGLLGWSHYSPADIGTDILDNMGASGSGATGFTPPVGAGEYSVWIQELSTGSFDYKFDFKLRSVRDGGPGLWSLAALVGIVAVRRRQA